MRYSKDPRRGWGALSEAVMSNWGRGESVVRACGWGDVQRNSYCIVGFLGVERGWAGKDSRLVRVRRQTTGRPEMAFWPPEEFGLFVRVMMS